MNDTELIQLLLAKDFAGLELLIDQYGDSIRRTIRSILRQDAEKNYWSDLENEVLYEIWRKVANYDANRASFATWLMLITRSRAIDKKRQIAKELQQTEVSPTTADNESSENTPLAEEHFLLLVDQLEPIDQKIFLDYYFYQQTPPEIAAALQLDPSAVYNHLSRGRRKLKSTLQERMDHNEL